MAKKNLKSDITWNQGNVNENKFDISSYPWQNGKGQQNNKLPIMEML